MGSEGFIVGICEEKDIAEILSIERDSFPSPWTERIFKSELTSPLSTVLVIRTGPGEGSRVAGYTVYWRVADEIHLHNIAVRRELRRQGVASRLLDEMIRRADRGKSRWISLEVRQGNLAAQRMYAKFGFSLKGVRPGYYTDTGEDALIMWMDLNQDPAEDLKAGSMERCRSDE